MSSLPVASDLPEGLTEPDQWVCWRTQERDGKQTKVPINPHRGVFASTTDPDSWGSFETARRFAADGSADGIGFVFTDEDSIVGVDLDDCRVPETGSLTDGAEAIVDDLDSYTEVSPSGTGVHVLVEGTLPDGRNRRDWVECYETARFFTVTGDHTEGTPTDIRHRTDELAQVHEQYLAPDEPGDPTPEDGGTTSEDGSVVVPAATKGGPENSSLADSEVVERAQNAANGEKFTRLWRGNTSGYDSHSEADMALCSLLAFWTARDAEQIDRLFRESGLMRPKWDEQHYADGSTYGEKTIERVIASTDEVYNPASSVDDTAATTEEGAIESPPSRDGASEATHTSDETAATMTPGIATEAIAGAPSDSNSQTDSTIDRSEGQQQSVANDHGSRSDSVPQVPSELASKSDDELLSLIGKLQGQVERLDAQNKRLQQQLDDKDDGGAPTSDNSESSRLVRLTEWVLR